MADSRIPGLSLIATPGPTDMFGTRRVAATRDERTTRAQLHTLQVGEQFLVPVDDDAVTPSIALGSGNDGWYSPADGEINTAFAGALKWQWSQTFFQGSGTSRPALFQQAATATAPVFVFVADIDSGLSRAAADAPNIVSGGVEAQRWTEATGVITAVEADVGLTAASGSSQGDGVILSSYNVYSTVGTAGDAATLPAVFTANNPSTFVYVKNDAATNSMDVFPASGDDAGAGSDIAVAVAAGDFAVFFATVANATWTKLMGGTA